MKSKVISFGIIVVLLLSAATNTAFAISNSGEGDWEYHRVITIQEKSGKTLNNYQVMVELDSSNFPDEAKSDGSDLRFIDTEDEKELSYFVEHYDAGEKTARIWVKVPKIPSGGTARIKMFYGNEKASSASDGDSTFDFFDDFDGDSLDNVKWKSITRGEYLVSVLDGELFIRGKCYNCGPDSGMVKVITKNSFSPPIIAEFNSTFVHSSKNRGKSSWAGLSENNKDAGSESWGDNHALFQLFESHKSFGNVPMTTELFTASKGESTETEGMRENYYSESYNIYTVAAKNNYAKLLINYDDEIIHTTNVPVAPMYGVLKVNAWQEGSDSFFLMDSYTDWFRIRGYAEPEPMLTIGDMKENTMDKSKSLDSTKTDYSNVSFVSISDLNKLSTTYDQRAVLIFGDIGGIESVDDSRYIFEIDDGSDTISVIYKGSLDDIKEGDNVTVGGVFLASQRTFEANSLQKSADIGVPGFEVFFAVSGLLAVAYLLRRK